jgi:uncharacterized protein YecT (DUF1311 family)
MRLSSPNDVLRAAAIALLLGLPCVVQAATPSFLCSKARTWVEKTICASERLSELDLELATVYARLLRVASGNAEKALTSDQHRWWTTRDECRRQAHPGECLETRYVQRIALLKARPDYTELRPGPVELPPERLSAVGEGWSKSLSRYLKAVRACLRHAPAPVKVVGAGWEEAGQEANVGLRMRGPRDENWVCTAARNGSQVLDFHEANLYETLPPEGPLFYPDPTAPPAGACGTPVQVLDEHEAPVGWLGPQCAETANRTPAETQ